MSDENWRYKFPFGNRNTPPGGDPRSSDQGRTTPLAPYTPDYRSLDDQSGAYSRRGRWHEKRGPRRSYRA